MKIFSTQENSPLVLIVENDKISRIQLCSMMKKEGYKVVEASNGEEGLAAVNSYHPNIILLDALMPVMDGFAFCTELQTYPGRSNIPILMITCLEDEESVNRAFEVGATDYITKPIHWAVLRQRVRRLLQASRVREELQQQSERERLIWGIAQHIRQSLSLEEIFNTTVAEVRQFLECDRVLFYRVHANGEGEVVSEAVVPGCKSILGQNITDPCFQTNYLELYRQGQVRAIADIEQADFLPCYIKFLQQLEVKSYLVVPILHGEAFWGVLLVHHCTGSRNWSNLEIGLLQQLASHISIALAQAEHLGTIKESELRFRQLAENIREVFYLVTNDRILYVSPAYEEIWGCSRESLYQRLTSWMDNIHPDDLDRIKTAFKEQQQSGKAINEEYRIVRHDGSIRWIRDRSFPIRNETGQVQRISGIAEDITARQQAEEEIRQALKKEKELNELKSRFVTMTSHEFRTPLSTILSSAELIQHYSYKMSDDKKNQHFNRILKAVKQITDLLNDILIFGKAEAGKLQFKPAPIDLNLFCSSLVEEVQVTAGSNYAIAFVNNGKFCHVNMDERLLQHILTNLLSNAIKYSPQGGKINLELVCQQKEVIFRIQDSGFGIPAAEQARLFRPFERGSNIGNISGTGLGLAIVKNCVDIHGGKITGESEVGVGTTFTVTLPCSGTQLNGSKMSIDYGRLG